MRALHWKSLPLGEGVPRHFVPLEFGHLEAGFHFVPEGRAIVAQRFIAGLAINMICVPEGRLKLEVGSGLLHGEEGESGTHSLRQSLALS
jgi:hypothetical protein